MAKVLLILLIVISSSARAEDAYLNAMGAISPDYIKKHTEILADDIFQGRGTGTMGGELASKYLALEYNKYGLTAIGTNDSYYQFVPMHASRILPGSELKLYINDSVINLQYGKDYELFRYGEQTYYPTPTEMVFSGYGIVAPEYDYNDYQKIDPEGKIAVFLGGEPISDDENFFGGTNRSVFSYPDSKQRIALSRGANGSIYIVNPETDFLFSWDEINRGNMEENVQLAYSVSNNLSLMLNPETAKKIFNGAKKSLDEVMNLHSSHAMESFPLKAKLSFIGNFKERDFIARNVIGMHEGSDPELKDSYVIITAHYDHLGIGEPVRGDSVYNGVMDNAIGCAALLELARVFSECEVKTKRSIIFLLVTGEEHGLLGSTYYTDHPVRPLYKTIANVNIDGIAAFDYFKSIIGIGAELSTLENTLYETARENNVFVSQIPEAFQGSEAFSKSDQIAFANAGIPAIMLYEGMEYDNMTLEEGIEMQIDYATNRYHTPFDDLTQKINYDAAKQNTQLLFTLIYKIANSEVAPQWKEGVIYKNERLRTQAEKR
jgi:hypothetical protein